MFQFKKSLASKEANSAAKLPNFYGKVRTLKEDLEKSEKGESEEDVSLDEASAADYHPQSQKKPLPPERATVKPILPKAKPSGTEEKSSSPEMFQSLPTPPPYQSSPPSPLKNSPRENPPSSSQDLPDFPSAAKQSFFADDSSHPKENIIPESSAQKTTTRKSGGKLAAITLLVLFLVIAGAGFYYYWFFIKEGKGFSLPFSLPFLASSSQTQTTTAPAKTTSEVPPAADTASTDENPDLRRLVVDTPQNPQEIEKAVANFANDYLQTSSEGDIVELKVLTKDDQSVSKKDFFTGFGITVPENISSKLSEDFSLFVKKEQDKAKIGFVFRTITSADLISQAQSWEPTMPSDLKSLYLEKENLSPQKYSFSSSQYKSADIRYFNFSSPANTSFDYSIISNFFVAGTSKDSMRSILDYMAEK